MKKDLAEVKAYAEAMADSNRVRDVYVNKEQDKFFWQLNRQRNDIDSLKERLEWLELRAKALELANESMLEWMDNMADKLCYCTWAEVVSQVWETLSYSLSFATEFSFSRAKLSLSLSMSKSLRTIRHTTRRMLRRAVQANHLLSIQLTFLLWCQCRQSMGLSHAVLVARCSMNQQRSWCQLRSLTQ